MVMPGFVDSHTHLIFGRPRLVDYEMRLAGASYAEIAAAGGGIQSSVQSRALACPPPNWKRRRALPGRDGAARHHHAGS